MVEPYVGEEIQYLGETVNGDRVVIRSLIVTKQGEAIPMAYRAQFNSIIQRSSYSDLVAKRRIIYERRPGERDTGQARRPAARR
jgi:hypothetical protein